MLHFWNSRPRPLHPTLSDVTSEDTVALACVFTYTCALVALLIGVFS